MSSRAIPRASSLVGLLAVAVSLIVGWLLARSITRPLGTLAAASHAIAGGDYGHQAPVTGSVEMRALAADFNYMAGQVQRAQAGASATSWRISRTTSRRR